MTILSDWECRTNPKKFHEFSTMITASYLVYDLIYTLIFMYAILGTLHTFIQQRERQDSINSHIYASHSGFNRIYPCSAFEA